MLCTSLMCVLWQVDTGGKKKTIQRTEDEYARFRPLSLCVLAVFPVFTVVLQESTVAVYNSLIVHGCVYLIHTVDTASRPDVCRVMDSGHNFGIRYYWKNKL